MAKKKETKAAKLDMFKQILPALDRRDKHFYASLSDDEKKEFVPYVAMRFMSSVAKHSAIEQLIMVNELVNHEFNTIGKHPELQWQLLALSGLGKSQFHSWIAPPRKVAKSKFQQVLLDQYPHYKSDEITLLDNLMTDDEKLEFLIGYGYTDKEIKEICPTK